MIIYTNENLEVLHRSIFIIIITYYIWLNTNFVDVLVPTMRFPFGIRNRVAMMTTIMTKGMTIEAFLSSADFFCHSNPLSSARVAFFTSKGQDKIDDKCFAMRCETGNGVNNNATVLEAMSENSTESVYVLPNETTAWHMGGSSNQKAERRDDKYGLAIKKFSSHKDQWIKETFSEWPSQCSIKDCSSVPTVGAHVVIDGKENVHLVPLCSRCNSDFSKNWVPDIKESGEIQPRNGFQLETGTSCLELNHISREECRVSYNPFSWIEMYDRLVLHIEKYNTTSISRRDTQLGQWVSYQRFRYKTLRTITSKEINLLEDIRFSWDPDGDSWNKKFALLKQYKHKNGDCNVPQQYEDNGVNLGTWLNTLRQEKKKKTIDAEKENKLDDLGVIWEPLIDQWDENFKLLQQYKLKNGDCDVPRYYEEHGVNLGKWLDTQRQEKKKNDILNAEKEKRLEGIGVIWEPKLNQWEEKYKLLEQFKNEKGHCNVSGGQKEDKKYRALGKWLTKQRIYYRKRNLENERQKDKRNNKLSDEKKEKLLEGIGIIWEPSNDKWEEQYELLEQFKNERGHCNVSQSQKEDRKYRALGSWLVKQRFYYRKGNRSEHLMKLDKLGVEWNLKRNRKE